MDRSRVLALLLWLGAVLATCSFVALVAISWHQDFGFRDALPIAVLFVALFLGHATAGLLIARREPGNAVGWLLLLAGLAGGLGFSLEVYAYAALQGWPGRLPGGEVAAAMRSPLLVGGLYGIPGLMLLVFPDGRGATRRWDRFFRVVGLTMAGAAVGGTFGTSIDLSTTTQPNPLAAPQPLGDILQGVGSLFFAAAGLAVIGGGISIVLRYRRSSGVERQQLKWFTSVAGVAGLFLGSWLAIDSVIPQGRRPPLVEAVFLLGLAALVLVPLAIAVAVLRYRLYEIDRLLSRTVSYAIVTTVLVATYGGAVMVLGQLLTPLTPESDLAVAASTLLVAALFTPVRRRVQAVVDRRFNRSRHDAVRTVEAFRSRLRHQVDLEQLTEDLRLAAEATVQPSGAALWLAPAGRSRA